MRKIGTIEALAGLLRQTVTYQIESVTGRCMQAVIVTDDVI